MVNYKDLGLVNTKELFANAIKGGYAIPAFNFNNLEQMQAIISACVETKSPVILQVSSGARKYANQTLLRYLAQGAVQYAKELGYEYFASLDGDGQHMASEIKKLQNTISKENQIIIGARNFDIANVPNGSKFGRWFSNFWACWDTGYKITDSLSGFRIYPISILDLPYKTSKFDWEMEVLVRHAWAGNEIVETVIECYYPKAEERVSHFRKFEDTMAIVWVHVQMLPIKWTNMFLNLFRRKNK